LGSDETVGVPEIGSKPFKGDRDGAQEEEKIKVQPKGSG
jgi:hypothetical protein